MSEVTASKDLKGMSRLHLPRVALLDDYQGVARDFADWSLIEDRCRVDVINYPLHGSVEDVAEVLRPYEVLCHLRERTPMSAELIDRLPNLRFMTITGKAHRTLDVAAATARGVAISHVSANDPPSYGAPELAWGLILAAARAIPLNDRNTRNGRWQTVLGMELHGKTLGLLGLGALGQQVARYGKAFGMDVIAWSPNLTGPRANEHGVRCVSKSELFALSDVVSIQLVLSERTRHLVGSQELSLMKREAVLVNTSRGPIIEEAALIRALSEGQIGAAGLDVFHEEPLPATHPLCVLSNVVLTPHIGYVTRDTFQRFYQSTLAGVAAYLDGAPMHLINEEVLTA